MRDSRTIVIDGLRGVAALAVAMFHFNEPNRSLSDPYHVALRYGYLGVTVFFVISGYCVTEARFRTTVGEFFRRRLLRIYPPYWASLLLVAVVGLLIALVYGLHNQRFLPDSPRVWLANVLCFAGPATGIQTMNEVSWTLTYELGFYLFIGLLLPRGGIWSVAGFSLLVLLWRSPPFPFNLWGTFGLGVALACWPRNAIAASLAAVFSIAQVVLAQGWTEGLLATVTGLLIGFPVCLQRPWLVRSLTWLGAISYSLYLIHVPLVLYLQPVLFGHFLPGTLPLGLLKDFCLLSISLLGAYLFYRAVEKPSHNYARRGRRETANLNPGP